MKRPLAFASALAVAAALVAVSTPANAAANFSPTTGITPGTDFNDVTISRNGTTPLCQSQTDVEATTGTLVDYIVLFASSADTVFDGDDDVLNGVYTEDVSYTQGATTSPTFDGEMPVLGAHDPANYLLAVATCYDPMTEHGTLHGSTVIGYRDVTMSSSTVAPGGSATINLIDATTDGQSCDAGFNTGPYSLGFQIYPTFAAFDNGDEPLMVIPEGWDNDGPGFGSFTESQLPSGVSGSFTVPTTLPTGSYVGVAYCINELGFWGDSLPLGAVPFTVGALADTGASTDAIAGVATLGSTLIALVGIVWVLRRRIAKA
ncbi:MAG: hypothetical protein ACOYNK_05250 [Microbacteriaceae bacterium]